MTNEVATLLEGNESKWVRITHRAFENIANQEGLGAYFINEYEALATSLSYYEFLRRLDQNELQLVIIGGNLLFQSLIPDINTEGLVSDRVLTALE